jgi:hypothetical protein
MGKKDEFQRVIKAFRNSDYGHCAHSAGNAQNQEKI